MTLYAMSLRYVPNQIAISAYMPVAAFVCCQGAVLMTIETHSNVVERRSFMTARIPMNTQPGSCFTPPLQNWQPGWLPCKSSWKLPLRETPHCGLFRSYERGTVHFEKKGLNSDARRQIQSWLQRKSYWMKTTWLPWQKGGTKNELKESNKISNAIAER